MSKSAMIIGLGALGEWTLEFLARSEGVDRIITGDVREEYGIMRTQVAAIGAALQGYPKKKLEFRKVDLFDIDGTAKLLETIKPDAIYSSVTLQSPRVLRIQKLRPDIKKELDEIGMGPWLPWHVTLPSKLMQAIEKAGISTHVVQASLPDVVNPALRGYGTPPTVGQGNHCLTAGEIIRKVSDGENVPLYYIGTHAMVMQGTETGMPFFMKILVGDRDVTSKYDPHALLNRQMCRNKVWLETVAYSFVGASAANNVMAIINDTNELINAPGPNGLPGGYPVRLSAKGAEVVLPKELTLEEAIRINTEANKWDGVEQIKDDGTVVSTDKAYSVMKEIVGYDCKELHFDELEQRAKELSVLYSKLVEKYGVKE